MPVFAPVFLCLCLLFSSNNWSRDVCLCTCFFVSMPFIFFLPITGVEMPVFAPVFVSMPFIFFQ